MGILGNGGRRIRCSYGFGLDGWEEKRSLCCKTRFVVVVGKLVGRPGKIQFILKASAKYFTQFIHPIDPFCCLPTLRSAMVVVGFSKKKLFFFCHFSN
jgi:hypothetical protein